METCETKNNLYKDAYNLFLYKLKILLKHLKIKEKTELVDYNFSFINEFIKEIREPCSQKSIFEEFKKDFKKLFQEKYPTIYNDNDSFIEINMLLDVLYNNNCRHTIIRDYVDIDPDNSKCIYYCTTCEKTF